MAVEAAGARSVGTRVRRVEDPRILTGRGRYVDDVVLPGMLHAAFLRSTVAHGRLRSVDVSEARELPGVVGVYTGDDFVRMLAKGIEGGSVVGMNLMPGMNSPTYWPLATDKVRYVGDPIAVVVAESRYVAEDALELIVEEIDVLDAVVSFEDALDPSKPKLFDEFDSNVNIAVPETVMGDVETAFAKADRVITASMHVHRQHPMPMETRGTIADWDPATSKLTVYTSTQSPQMPRMILAPVLDVSMDDIRVLSADVGGGFGLKQAVGREDVAVAAISRELGRPVKWIEDRLEHIATAGHAREETADVEVAITADGVILGVRMDMKFNLGAYPGDPFPGSVIALMVPGMFQGPLKVEGVESQTKVLFSNKATYVSYRGPWATADFTRERLLDVVAHELGEDPLEIRRRNYVVRDEPPLAMLNGRPFVGVTIRESLDQAAEIVDWAAFRERQRAAREEGRYLGVGIASYLEAAPGPAVPGQGAAGVMGNEVAILSVERDGTVVIVTKQQPHGQGHETTLSQVAADELGVRMEDVVVKWGDTAIIPMALVGTGGSRAATMANGVVLHGSRELKHKVLALAADVLEANPADLEMQGGVVSVRGTPSVTLPLAELARIVADEPERFDAEADVDLSVTQAYDGGESGWSGGTHCCVVDVDVETGLVAIERYVIVEDCGVPVNPAIVEGQIRGGVTQAIGAVLLEHAAYDEDGNLQAASLMDYLMPTTALVPRFEIHHVETFLTDPDVNFRGVGEGGMIVAPAAIVNAIEDALQPFGVRIEDQHLPPARIVELVQGAGGPQVPAR